MSDEPIGTYEPWQTLAQAQERIAELERENAELRAKLDAVPVDAITKLRTHLSVDGEYSICREDYGILSARELVMFDSFFVAVDAWLDVLEVTE